MVFHTIRCSNCTETRVGRDTPTGVRPVQDECPSCGSTSYGILSTSSRSYAESAATGQPEREHS